MATDNQNNNEHLSDDTIPPKDSNEIKDNDISSEQNELAELQKKYDVEHNALLRTMADLQNLQKRSDKDRYNAYNDAISSFAKDLLNVLDSIENAIKFVQSSSKEQDDNKVLYDGMILCKKEFIRVLSKYNINAIETKAGDEFDASIHQAASVTYSKEFKDNQIIDVMQTGYKINNSLIRPSIVIVAQSSDEA